MSTENKASTESMWTPPQFTLRGLILLTAWCAAGLVLAVQWSVGGGLVFCFFSCVALICYGAIAGKPWLWGGGLMGLVFNCCIAGLLPALAVPRTPARQSQCRNSLRMIALALHHYHDTYDAFPPAYIADDQGRPMHSWRVLILPFIEQKNLYAQYRFDEPWNGPNNSKLASSMPRYVFFCPSDPNPKNRSETSYLAVIGPGTVWPGATPTTMNAITDGTSNTLLVVEVHNSGINWMEPRDLDIRTIPMTINAVTGLGLRSAHKHGTQAAFVDAHVQMLPNNTPTETLRALFTIDGGEAIGDF